MPRPTDTSETTFALGAYVGPDDQAAKSCDVVGHHHKRAPSTTIENLSTAQ